jgi:heme/copper-type cytochrome/quinol oxidase subunit 2
VGSRPQHAVNSTAGPRREGIGGLKPGIDCINPHVKKVVDNVVVGEDGRYYVNLIGLRYTWLPRNIILTDPKEVKFRITAPDVIHGFQIAGTNVNIMVLPGYIAEITWKVPANIPPESI